MRRTMMIHRFERPPKHQHVHLKSRARKALRLLESAIASSIRSVSSLKASTDREFLALSTEANSFSCDLQEVVYSLEKIVIKSFKDGKSDADLGEAVASFSKFAYSVQQCFNNDSESLKSQITSNLGKIMPEARRLVQAVEKDANHEYKPVVVNILEDILLAVQKIDIRNQIENYSTDEIMTETIRLQKAIREACNSLRTESLEVLRDLKLKIRSIYEKHLEVVQLVFEMADCYDGEIQNTLLQTTFNLIHHIAEIDSSFRRNDDVESTKCYLIISVASVCTEVEIMLQLLNLKINTPEIANNLNDLVLHYISTVMASAADIVRCIESVSEYTNK